MDKIILENFKVFRERTEFELAPITILTGKNSSGKSSVIKGLLLLADYIEQQGGPLANQLELRLLDGKYSEKHRLNIWENTTNWTQPENRTIQLAFEQKGIEYSFAFGGIDPKDSRGIFQESTVSDKAGRSSVFRRLSENDFQYEVPLALVEAIAMPSEYTPERVLAAIAETEQTLETLAQQKEQGSGTGLVAIISQEQKLESRLQLLQEQLGVLSSQETDTSETISEVLDLKDHPELLQKPLGSAIRMMVNRFYDNKASVAEAIKESEEETGINEDDSTESKHSENPKKETKPTDIAFQFTEELGKRSAFRLGHLSPNRVRQTRLFSRFDKSTAEFQKLINWYATTPLEGSSLKAFLEAWMQKLDIGTRLEVHNLEGEAATVKVHLPGKEQPADLADLGYGMSQLVAILLAILKLAYDAPGRIHTARDLRVATSPASALLIIEEAEANLHPNLQSKLADLFIAAYESFGIKFLLESHSEYLVRKLQLLIAKGLSPETAIIYYMDARNGVADVRPIQILADGMLSDHFGEGFFDEADTQAMGLFQVQNQKR